MISHYKTLGVERTADQNEIKIAYRQMTIKWHPDKNPGDASAEEKFKHVVDAYEVLSDPEKRMIYDLGLNDTKIPFDVSFVDPSLINEDEFVQTFANLFGDYLDAKIPGGFRSRVNRAGDAASKQKKKRKKKGQSVQHTCDRCKDSKRIRVSQGNFKVYISCTSCR